MVLILVLLGIAGFFFPPAWLGLVGYAIYIYASRESRRNHAIESRVAKMVARGQQFSIFENLYFEAARGYAVAKGSKAADNDGASARMLVDSRLYFVVFSRAVGGGTSISIEYTGDLESRV